MENEKQPEPRVEVTRVDGWAAPVKHLKAGAVPAGAINLNVEGRQLAGPLQGFGKLWQKTYRVRLSGCQATPEEVMQIWKERFPEFQPPENHFYPSMAGVQPGEIVWIDTNLPVVPGLRMIPYASGVMVMYADETSFTVATPEGFADSGWNTFSTFEEDGVTVAQVQSLVRAADPIYEFGNEFMGGSQMQEATWTHVLTRLSQHFQVQGQVQFQKVCLDERLQWNRARNVWLNAGVRTMLYRLATPVRWVGRQLRRTEVHP